MSLKRPVPKPAPAATRRPSLAAAPSDLARRLQQARQGYEAGQEAQACAILTRLIEDDPRLADAHHLLGLCLISLRQFEAAEASLHRALALDRRDPGLHVVLGDLILRPGRLAEAERAYRAALAIDRHFAPAALALHRLMIFLGRYEDALQVTAPLFVRPDPSGDLLAARAEALKHLGLMEEALDLNRRAVEAGAAHAQLEVSAALRELGRYEDAEAAARQAFARLGRPPGALIIHGRVLQNLGRVSEAEAAYREVLAQDPVHDGAHEHLGDLLWDGAEAGAGALDILDRAMAHSPTPRLVLVKSRILSRAGRWDEAYALLSAAAETSPDNASLQSAAARAAIRGHGQDPQRVAVALAHAERADAIAPDVPKVAAVLGEIALAAGQPERSSSIAARLLRHWPQNQSLIALQAVAWRIMGDARYRELYDYDRVVASTIIDAPKGWPDLGTYLADLAAALQKFHAVRLDTFGLSRREGVETRDNISPADGSAIRAFFEAIAAPLDDYVARMGRGRDLLRRRNQGGHRTKAAWSVKTQPHGFHDNHLHPEGWLSSAFYVELPPAVEEGRQGWIKFGQPGIPTRPALEAEHFVKPDPGRFMLFPSYMWHGTLPYTGAGTRLVMSVDVAPAGR